jgi:Tol biopolymer transport system component
VFARRETGGVYAVSTHGGAARLLAPAQRAHAPRFSPDGRSIAYWTGQTVWTLGPLFTFIPRVNPVTPVRNVAAALFVAPSEGGTPRALATDFISARYAVWSPDGGNILFLGEGAPADITRSTGMSSGRMAAIQLPPALSRCLNKAE